MTSTFRSAVERLLDEHAGRLPDWSGITLLVPHHHVAPRFMEALRARITAPVLLPPRLMTLPDLAATVVPAEAVQSDSMRLVELHAFLGRVDWLPAVGRWPLAQAMHRLMQEMDDALLRPPADFADFSRQVEAAAGRGLSRPLQWEARLVFELWRAFQGAAPGSRGGYALRLAGWLATATGPIYSLGLHAPSRLEQAFLEQCRERLGLVELAAPARYPERLACLQAAWEGGAASPLHARAAAYAARQPESPLAGEIELLAAGELEAAAQAAARQLRLWLAEGRQRLAIVALDRLAARRLRAVLERHAILLQDETGWTFSTATVSHVLDRWLTLLQDDCYYRDLIDFLKSPFLFADIDATARLDAVAELETQIHARNVVSGLAHFVALAGAGAGAALPLLRRLEAAARRFVTPRRRPLADWQRALLDTLDTLGATPAFEADNAGRQLLDLMRHLALDLAAARSAHTLADWRAWLTLQLDQATFQEGDIDSPLRLTHLAAARWRDFDGVVVLGADAGHLPPAGDDGLISDALRAQLGLPGQRERRAESLTALTDVLARSERVLLIWQTQRGRDPNPVSPWLLELEAFHRLAYGRDLRRGMPAAVMAPAPPSPPPRPAPSLPALPARLSASGWQDMVDCPYRFYAHYGLALAQTEEVAEEMEKADYGELVHDVLSRFHAAHPVLAAAGRERLVEALTELGRTVFSSREGGYYLAQGWRLRWERHLSAYVDWALAWEAAGHRWRQAECDQECAFALGDGRQVMLRGRLDRIDDGPGGVTVLDYKTQARQVLQKKVKTPGEHVQLPFYGLLTGAAEAVLVGLDEEPVRAVSLPRPLPAAAAAEAERLRSTLNAVAAGVPLPAQGTPQTCDWCELRGLCRRDHWFDTPSP